MSETTRRQFLEVAGVAAAATFLAPAPRAGAQVAPVPPLPPGASPLPIGPGGPYSAYQSEIYIAGMGAGVEPIFTTDLTALEGVAAKAMSPEARRHLLAWAGGAEAVRENAKALARRRIVPRMFLDRAERDLTTTVLGARMPAPIVLGPVGAQRLVHPDAEAATARAAAAAGLTYVHAAQASTPVGAVAVAAPGAPRWFAIDWPDAGLDVAQLTRARDAGCTHLLVAAPPAGKGWGALAAVRKAWGRPLLVGGIQTPADARRAVRAGADGLVVSNERGRRGAEPVGTIDALPEVVAAVGDRTPVLLGSGVLTGTDVFRAVALGARAVLITRPYVHGLALRGDTGVQHVLRTLLAELDITLGVAGVAKARDLRPDALVRA